MSEKVGRFVARLQSCEVPKEPRGRYTRFVIDVDADAVRDYVMFDAKGSTAPWPVAVITEMVTALSEWAQHEEFAARIAANPYRFGTGPTHE